MIREANRSNWSLFVIQTTLSDCFTVISGYVLTARLSHVAGRSDEKSGLFLMMTYPRSSAELWYYVLEEAHQQKFAGNYLGPVGGRIVMETLRGPDDGGRPVLFAQTRCGNEINTITDPAV